MGRETLFDIALPVQELSHFTHFKPDVEAARAWANQLPVTNIRAVSIQLLAALHDLNHYPLRPDIRADLLETLSDHLRVTLTNLTRRFLNQPLVMPPEPQRLAELTDALLGEAQTAYSIVAIETLRQAQSIREVNPARLLGEALFLALRFAGQRILLAFQLHRPAPLGSWQSLHRLYALGEWQGLDKLPLSNSPSQGNSITSAYLQALMLGCAKPNQLLQSDLEAIYHALGQWHDKLQIGAAGAMSGLFCVDLASDQPAVYSALYGDTTGAKRRVINCERLVSFLRSLRAPDSDYDGGGVRLQCGLTLSDNMLAHLVESLGSMSMRTFKRIISGNHVLVSTGISGAHYHAAGEHSFQQLLHGRQRGSDLREDSSQNPFHTPRRRDVWDVASSSAHYERRTSRTEREPEPGPSHNIDLDIFTRSLVEEVAVPAQEQDIPIHRVRQRNASPGGYCLEWDQSLPEDVRNGDILCLQENPRASWSIAAIRWVSRQENAHTLVGVELLSPHATACGIQRWQKVGESRTPQRGLLLPAINLIGQPPTLITPRAGFREGMKVSLLRHGEVRHIQLQRQLAATASFAQFEFRDIRRLEELLAEDRRGPVDSVYDSVWSNI